MTASEAIFEAGHIGSYWQITHRRDTGEAQIVAAVTTISAANSNTIRVANKWQVFTYGTWAATLFLERYINGTWEVVRSWTSNKDRNVIADGEVDVETDMRLRVSAGTSEAATGADVPRFVLEATDATVNGLVKITAVGSLDADGKTTTATANVIVPLFATTATPIWTEGAWSEARGYPRTVAIHGQRLWFGGTAKEPTRIWGSVIADFENFRRSSFDDASVSFTPAAQQSNRLQWMVSHGENLVLGTSGDEWTVTGATDAGTITPVSVQIQRRSGYGSQYIPALLIGEVIAFVQRGGRKLREVAPRDNAGLEWQAADLTVLAEHVAKAGIVQTAAMHFPQSILWAVTTDGQLLGMTFEQEQNVFAWHVHETDGLVESVGVVFGEVSDEVWLQVNRDGARSIERLDVRVMSRDFDDFTRLIYLDAALVLESDEKTDTFAGLEHLEGRFVSVLGDGAELATVRVQDGEVTLGSEVNVAVIGLPFTSELQPMRLEIPLRDGTAQGRKWKTARVALTVHESLGGEVGDSPTASKFEPFNYRRVATPMDSAPPLFTGDLETAISATAREGVDLMIRTSSPLPLNIGSIVVKGDVYGE